MEARARSDLSFIWIWNITFIIMWPLHNQSYCNISMKNGSNVIITLWKEILNSDGQQFQQYHLNQQSLLGLNHWTYERPRLLSILTHLRQHLRTYSLNTISCMLIYNVFKLIIITSALELIQQWQQEEEFEDNKGAIKIRLSKKNRQHNG